MDASIASRRLRVAIVSAALLVYVCALAYILGRALYDPQTFYLRSDGVGRWIRFAEPPSLLVKAPQVPATWFRHAFRNHAPLHSVDLTFRAFRGAEVRLDGRIVFTAHSDRESWKPAHDCRLAEHLEPGAHELIIAVTNWNAPPMLAAKSRTLNMSTDVDWQASIDGGRSWSSCDAGDTAPLPALSTRFQPAHEALLDVVPYLLPLAAVIAFMFYRLGDARAPAGWLSRLGPHHLRWLFVAAWVLLGLNNLHKLPLGIGMDIRGHFEYIDFIVKNKMLPHAGAGWQMFEAPLFYLVAAPFYAGLRMGMTDMAAFRLLRIIPLVCNLLLLETTYRVLRTVYPDRRDLQTVGLLGAGLLPVNLYVGQVVGSEPLSAALSALAILMSVKAICSPTPPSGRYWALCGSIVGLAILAKITAIMLTFCILLTVVLLELDQGDSVARGISQAARKGGAFVACLALTCGWYFRWNFLLYGKPLITGNDPARGFVWWQDPGYRVMEHFSAFGRALIYPIYASFAGFWDALYSTLWCDGQLSGVAEFLQRPPWNYPPMLAVVWFGLLPSALMMVGAVSIAPGGRTRVERCLWYGVGTFAAYMLAMAFFYMSLPAYCSAKAKYLSGLTPCLGLLLARGYDRVGGNPVMRAVCGAVLTACSLCSLMAYYIL